MTSKKTDTPEAAASTESNVVPITAAKKGPKPIDDEVNGYAVIIRKHVQTTGGSVGDAEPASPYINTLPDSLTPDQVLALRKHDDTFVPAVALVSGELCIEAMAKDGELKTGQGHFDMLGGKNAKVVVQRSRTFTPPPSADGTKSTPVEHKGYTTAVVTTNEVSGGSYTSVAAHLRSMAAGLL